MALVGDDLNDEIAAKNSDCSDTECVKVTENEKSYEDNNILIAPVETDLVQMEVDTQTEDNSSDENDSEYEISTQSSSDNCTDENFKLASNPTCPEAEDNSFSENDSKSETSVQSSPGNLIDEIFKLANDRTCINGPETYGYIMRDINVREKERKNKIELHLIANSLSRPVDDTILIWLVELRNIFSCFHLKDQSDITRLVFDPTYRNLILVQHGNVFGGICFRMFPTQNFSEIVFVGVIASNQGNGYGTHMMNHLKDYHIKHNHQNLVALVPAEAVCYFEKQGFSKITLSGTDYEGYIHMCEGDNLMECKLDKRITYVELSEALSRQKKIIKRLIEKYGNSIADLQESNNSNLVV